MLAPGKRPDEPGGRAIGLAPGRSGPVPDPLEDLQGSRQEYLRAPSPGSGLPRLGGRPFGPGPHRATRFPCPSRPRGFRGQSHVRHRAPFAGIPDESRRRVDNSLKEEYTQ